MSQASTVIADGSGAAVLSAINGALAALLSCNSGASAPSSPVAGMFWADTTAQVLKQRNAGNTAWNTLFSLTRDLAPAQTWQDFTASRALGTVYTNSSGYNISVNVLLSSSTAALPEFVVDSVSMYGTGSSVPGVSLGVSCVVPAGATYLVRASSGTGTLGAWRELR